MLEKIVVNCTFTYQGFVFKAVYLLAYFSFLRISNLVSHSIASFSPLRQLTRGDVSSTSKGLQILIKWTKTLQTQDKAKYINVPRLAGSPICPVAAIKFILQVLPGDRNAPLFQVLCHSRWVPLTESRLRKHFTAILKKLNLFQCGFTFHSFRRSGATWAFNNNVSLQNIQQHGTWSSDCVWSYITQDQNTSSQVADTFQSLLSNPT